MASPAAAIRCLTRAEVGEGQWLHGLGVAAVLRGGLTTARPAGLSHDFDATAAAGGGGDEAAEGAPGARDVAPPGAPQLLTVEALAHELLLPALYGGTSDAVRWNHHPRPRPAPGPAPRLCLLPTCLFF